MSTRVEKQRNFLKMYFCQYKNKNFKITSIKHKKKTEFFHINVVLLIFKWYEEKKSNLCIIRSTSHSSYLTANRDITKSLQRILI